MALFSRGTLAANAVRKLLLQNASVCQANALLKTSACLNDGKTPVQVIGYDYLKQQETLKRPLSPHLTIYEPQITSILSILHRISGAAIGVGALVVVSGVLVSGADFAQVISSIHHLGLPAPLLFALKATIAWPIVYHYFNGIRFLGFEVAKGMDLPTVYKSGWTVVALSIVVSILLAFWRNEA